MNQSLKLKALLNLKAKYISKIKDSNVNATYMVKMFEHNNHETREMAEWLKALTIFSEDPGSIFPAPTWQLITVCNSNSRYLYTNAY